MGQHSTLKAQLRVWGLTAKPDYLFEPILQMKILGPPLQGWTHILINQIGLLKSLFKFRRNKQPSSLRIGILM